MNILETIGIGAPICNVINAHSNYVNATRVYVWNGDPQHVIIDAIISYFTINHILKIIEIELVSSKMLCLLNYFILPCVRSAVIGVLRETSKSA